MLTTKQTLNNREQYSIFRKCVKKPRHAFYINVLLSVTCLQATSEYLKDYTTEVSRDANQLQARRRCAEKTPLEINPPRRKTPQTVTPGDEPPG